MISTEQSIWSKIDQFARSSLPFWVSVLCVIVAIIPLHIPFAELIKPMLTLSSIYYWTIYRPDLMPMYLVFILGMCQDILLSSPIGISSFVFLIISFLAGTQRRFFHGKSFSIIWWGFMIIALLAAFLSWIVFCLIEQQYVTPMPFVFKYLISLASFPIVFVGMNLVHKMLPTRN